jgi:cytochrome P450
MTSATTAAPAPLPGRGGLPYVGQTLRYIRDPNGFLREQHERYGAVSWIRAMGRRWVVLLGADASGAVFRNADHAFANGPAWSYLVGPFFDRGLMLLDFEEHHRHRRIMQQAFTADRIARSTDAMHEPVETALDTWPEGELPVYPALKDLTLDLATQLFMGGAPNASAEEMAAVNRAFIDCVQAATAVVRADLPGTRWRRALRGRRLLEDFLQRHLPRARAEATDDLFSALCHARSDEGEVFTDADVVNHMIFLLMAAHDTSTITLSTMLQHLGQHPEWQERCRSEVLALDTTRPRLQDHRALPSIDLVMKECLRIVAPVPVLARQVVKDTEVLGHRISAGTMAMTSPAFVHHDPALWVDPERFDPERFSPERRDDKAHRYAWHPFGGGVHKCLGMHFAGAEITTVMTHLLRRFTWDVDPDYVCPLDYTSLPFPADGQPVRLRRR